MTKTQGALENGVANLLNNGVGLFNKAATHLRMLFDGVPLAFLTFSCVLSAFLSF